MPAPPAVATFVPEEKQKAMKTFITSIALMILLTAIPAAAQNITGRLVDESGDPVAYASVVIISRPDSAYMTGATSA